MKRGTWHLPAKKLATTSALVVLAVLFVATVGGCQASSAAPPPAPGGAGEKVSAVATFNVLGDMVANVAGERAEIRTMLPIGTDPHTYEPVPADIQAVASADVVFYNGNNMEGWIERLLRNAGGRQPAVALTQGITPLRDKNGDPDPHMWQSPLNAIRYVENIREGLIRVDPEGAALYRANADAYIAKLRELDAWAAQEMGSIPPERRKLVMTHDAYQYLAERYGVEIVGSIWGITTQDEPSAQEIGQLVLDIKAAGVPVVFVETTVNPKLMEQIARDAGVKIGGKIYAESLAPKGEPADNYIGLVQTNVKAFVEGLR